MAIMGSLLTSRFCQNGLRSRRAAFGIIPVARYVRIGVGSRQSVLTDSMALPNHPD